MITAIVNQKGGVGKSTTADALGAGLTECGHKVLLIDLDAQANITYTHRAVNDQRTTYDILLGKCSADESIQHTDAGDIIPADRALSTADAILKDTGREYRLKESLEPIKNKYDNIIIDTPPSLGILTINALTAADEIIIPAQADIYSLQGIEELARTIGTVKQYTNSNLTINGILITRYNARSILNKQMADNIDQLADAMKTRLYSARIREGVAIKEAQAMRQSIFEYAPRAKATQDYKEFITEYLKGGEK